MTAWDGEGEYDVEASLFADTGESVDDSLVGVVDSLKTHAAFIEDELEAVGAVLLLEELGNGPGAEETVGFFIKTESQQDGAGGLPLLG